MTRAARGRWFSLAVALLSAGLGVAGCGGEEAASDRATPPPSPEASLAVARAAEAVWTAIDAYDAKAFAAASVAPDGKTFRALEAKDVESLVMDLHQKYGARGHQLVAGPAPTVASSSATVYVVIGDREDALSLTFVRHLGAWKLTTVSNADPQAVGPDAK